MKNSIFSKTTSFAKKKNCEVLKHKKWKLLYFLSIFEKSRFGHQNHVFLMKFLKNCKIDHSYSKIKKRIVADLKMVFLGGGKSVKKIEKFNFLENNLLFEK